MDVQRQIERDRTKAFYALLVERLGEDVWAERKAAYVERVRAKESQFNIKLPVEPQLFVPTEDDIDWYILACYLSHTIPYSDSAYSSRRIYPYAMAIGAVARELERVPNVADVLDKMLANNNQPEKQIFELLTAAFYIKNGYEVSFIPEGSITWPDGKTKKSPDMLVTMGDCEFYVECKRAQKQTQYSEVEGQAWAVIWDRLSHHMFRVAPWCTVDITFHQSLAEVAVERVLESLDRALKDPLSRAINDLLTVEVQVIDKKALKQHYRKFSVRPNSPQQELLVFGNMDSNEKRSIATLAKQVIRPGTGKDILNLFVKDVANCVGAQWRCHHEESLRLRSKHFKGLVHDGVSQIPSGKPGLVHILYETRDGIKIEELRRDKNLENISKYDASQSSAIGVFLHSVNYYPFEDDYDWAETVDNFGRIPDLFDLFPRQTLMISAGSTLEVPDITHWQQDKSAREIR
ncbi:hypothetical protein AO069_06540 [Pseudomonas syringae pv. syringae PD2774]|uniref:hypothetical protein n=1 Tax=Pseudomonas syringae TaxID=317 RepID=UPI000737793D|nr:hypothetical protein [Pseudomonas syringae]KTB88294.1 hypothetical protein AO069_06540 [Pseudomonas syringae pv. syringae PD2774]